MIVFSVDFPRYDIIVKDAKAYWLTEKMFKKMGTGQNWDRIVIANARILRTLE